MDNWHNVGDRVTTGRNGPHRLSPNFTGTIVEIIPTYRVRLDSGGHPTTEAAGLEALDPAEESE
ncbi:hypothetical protein GTE6_7 [Gordonia phage GTE6]|uniref:Uncharacterized protein n=1 Tax=Gordonia phage GTE6 TaxID=1647474 RepID=A0A0K0MWU3_9CAUD|nr:hypothetical protein AU100_gp07 [Gordonia phage GTE6]AKI28649.1 hypothetical protein GTE6_7 [Gordonia phage GTE6]